MGLKILKSSNFRAKNGFGPNLKAGMDATILKESFATNQSYGSAEMLKKSNDFRFLLEETSFLRPAAADRNS